MKRVYERILSELSAEITGLLNDAHVILRDNRPKHSESVKLCVQVDDKGKVEFAISAFAYDDNDELITRLYGDLAPTLNKALESVAASVNFAKKVKRCPYA